MRRLQLLWRRLQWGFPEEDLWNLYQTQAEWILPRLKRFKQIHMGYPGVLEKEDEANDSGNQKWNEILNKMIVAFEYIAKDDIELFNPYRIRPEVEEGLRLFHDYYFNLWD